MKYLAILLCSFTLLVASSYEKKVETRLCGLIGQREMAKFYGDVRSMDSFEKKIESYKFRHGIENFDENSCHINGYYPVDPNYAPYPPNYRPYYQNEYERFDRFQRGYRGGYYDGDNYDDGFERGYRRGYKDGNRDYRDYRLNR
ncbi:gamma-glutamyl phosphate reductase [uncultured Campylobacter sp.]|uniref:gamma-glutamyl phosphate reductase n=1 Tax=uncultured Campylobacter sp. TaxID=218934 RepID=UPI00262778A0|nr:gamma-glutamyl phosphate reductase [uncultured Campylobacter sp.]